MGGLRGYGAPLAPTFGVSPQIPPHFQPIPPFPPQTPASHPTEPNLLHADADALQRLVALSHGHSRECGFVPDVKPPTPGSPAPLVWECVAGHSFTWGGPSDAPQRGDGGGGGSNAGPIRRRSLRRSGVAMEVMEVEPEAMKDDGVWAPGGGGDGGEFGMDGIIEHHRPHRGYGVWFSPSITSSTPQIP